MKSESYKIIHVGFGSVEGFFGKEDFWRDSTTYSEWEAGRMVPMDMGKEDLGAALWVRNKSNIKEPA